MRTSRSNPTWGKPRIQEDIVAIDFFVVPTATFRVLYVFLVMSHDRRRILHFNVTTSPSARWTARQVREAFPYDTAPRYLLGDRDSIFGTDFVRRVESMGIEKVVTAPGSLPDPSPSQGSLIPPSCARGGTSILTCSNPRRHVHKPERAHPDTRLPWYRLWTAL